MSQVSGCYHVASSDIALEEFDGEMVVLNLASGHYFAMNRTSSFLFKAVLRGHKIEELSSIDAPAFSSEDVARFVGDLLSHDLIAADDSAQPVSLDPATIREANTCTEKLELEVHDDLADLIIADPIHDADVETGWPAKPNEAA